MSAPHTPQVKALNCPSCGAPLTIRGMGHSLTVVCESCLSVLDAKDPNFQVLQKFEAQERIQPEIPLGTRGKWHNAVYEAIGFQRRGITVDGVCFQVEVDGKVLYSVDWRQIQWRPGGVG